MGLGWDPGGVQLPPPMYNPAPVFGTNALASFFNGPQASMPVIPGMPPPPQGGGIRIGDRFQSPPPPAAQQTSRVAPPSLAVPLPAPPGGPPASPGVNPVLGPASSYARPLSGVGGFLADMGAGGGGVTSIDPVTAFMQGLSGSMSSHTGRAVAERQYADTMAQRDFENRMKQMDLQLSQGKLDAEINNRKDTLGLGRERNDIAAARVTNATDPNSPVNKANASRANYYDARAANVGGGGAPTITELNAAQSMADSETARWAKTYEIDGPTGRPPSEAEYEAHKAKLVDDNLAFNRRAMGQPPLGVSRAGGAPGGQPADQGETDLTEGGNYGKLGTDQETGRPVVNSPPAREDAGAGSGSSGSRPPGVVGRAAKAALGGSGTKDAPYAPKSVDDMKSMKAGDYYVSNGALYKFTGLSQPAAR